MARPVLSSTAGLLIGAALVGGAALRLTPEPVVTPVVDLGAPAVAVLPVVLQTAAPLVIASAPAATAALTATAPPAATAAPVVAPAPLPPLLAATAYRSSGRSYAAVSAGVDATLDSPMAGRVEIRLYQWINGQIRTGANVATLPYFPYVVVRSTDRVLTLRPGALGVDSELLVRDGATVSAGTPLVRVMGTGASSWRTFYDRTLEAQVIASLTTAAGADLDAVPLFARH